MIEAKYTSEFIFTKDTPYLALPVELWGVFCKDMGKYWLRYNGTAMLLIFQKMSPKIISWIPFLSEHASDVTTPCHEGVPSGTLWPSRTHPDDVWVPYPPAAWAWGLLVRTLTKFGITLLLSAPCVKEKVVACSEFKIEYMYTPKWNCTLNIIMWHIDKIDL